MIVKSPGLRTESHSGPQTYGRPLVKVSEPRGGGNGQGTSQHLSFGEPIKPAKNGSKRRMLTEKISITPWKVISFSLILGLGGYLYITHVFTTQAILAEVNLLKNEYERARIQHTDLKFTYDRLTGPAEVYESAKKLGLVDGGPADRIIIIK